MILKIPLKTSIENVKAEEHKFFSKINDKE